MSSSTSGRPLPIDSISISITVMERDVATPLKSANRRASLGEREGEIRRSNRSNKEEIERGKGERKIVFLFHYLYAMTRAFETESQIYQILR